MIVVCMAWVFSNSKINMVSITTQLKFRNSVVGMGTWEWTSAWMNNWRSSASMISHWMTTSSKINSVKANTVTWTLRSGSHLPRRWRFSLMHMTCWILLTTQKASDVRWKSSTSKPSRSNPGLLISWVFHYAYLSPPLLHTCCQLESWKQMTWVCTTVFCPPERLWILPVQTAWWYWTTA